MRVRLLFAFALAAFLAAVGYLAVVVRDRGPQPAVLSWAQLANATYPVELAPSKQVTLQDGAYEQTLVPGGASKLQVRLAEIAGFGAIAGSDDVDAAVVLTSSAGGSGTFVHLVAVLNDHGAPQPAATVLLGDRVAVRGIEVNDHDIIVRMRIRGATEPFTNLSREVTRRYSLEGAQLVLKEETTTDVPFGPPSDFTYRTQSVSPKPGAAPFTATDELAPGQSAAFTIHGEAGQRLRVRATSEFSNAVLSIQGLGDLTQLVSRDDFSTSFDGALPSTQEYSIRVISLAGANLKFSLSMALSPAPPSTGAATTPTAVVPTAGVPTPTAAVPTVGVPTPTPPADTPGATPPTVFRGPFRPSGQPLAVLAPKAVDFAQGREAPWSIAVAEPGRGVRYSLNGDAQLELASVVKILIMAAVFGMAEQEGRYVDDVELSLLWPMITQSDNDAATSLWRRIGGGKGLAAYLQSSGFEGVAPYDGPYWGTSTASANALVNIVARTIYGDLYQDEHRKLALKLMTAVVPQQRWGISAAANSHDGDVVAIKNGWYPDDRGWRVNSVGVVIPGDPSRAPYVVAVLTNLQPSFAYGIETIEGVAEQAGSALRGANER